MPEFTEKENEAMKGMFKVPDMNQVSRPRIIHEALLQKAMIDQLLIELFCENPHHEIFEKWPETRLAPMRIERIRRKK